jgi:hypothetical protein
MAMIILRAAEAASPFAEWRALRAFSGMDSHPIWGEFGRRYYPVVFGNRRIDASFAVVDGTTPLLIAQCCGGDACLDWYGLPIRLSPSTELPHDSARSAIAKAVEYIEAFSRERRLDRASILDPMEAGRLSPIGEACLGRGWFGALSLSGSCYLADGEAGLRRALRKSFRSLVNWGRNNLTMTYVNAANPDPDQFAAYRQFHFKVAGRSTRPEASWTAMFDWIAAGGGELALGRLDTGDLVAGSLVMDGTNTAYYSSGVYDRERFDKPLAHFPLYDAILRSGLRGMKRFDVGEIPQVGTATAKEFNIGYFKRGFVSEIKTSIHWSWSRAADEAGGIQ